MFARKDIHGGYSGVGATSSAFCHEQALWYGLLTCSYTVRSTRVCECTLNTPCSRFSLYLLLFSAPPRKRPTPRVCAGLLSFPIFFHAAAGQHAGSNRPEGAPDQAFAGAADDDSRSPGQSAAQIRPRTQRIPATENKCDRSCR